MERRARLANGAVRARSCARTGSVATGAQLGSASRARYRRRLRTGGARRLDHARGCASEVGGVGSLELRHDGKGNWAGVEERSGARGRARLRSGRSRRSPTSCRSAGTSCTSEPGDGRVRRSAWVSLARSEGAPLRSSATSTSSRGSCGSARTASRRPRAGRRRARGHLSRAGAADLAVPAAVAQPARGGADVSAAETSHSRRPRVGVVGDRVGARLAQAVEVAARGRRRARRARAVASTPSATVLSERPNVSRAILVSISDAGCSALTTRSGRRSASSNVNMIWASLLWR